MTENVLTVENLSIDYESNRGPVHALDSVSIGIQPRSLTAIVGESGCGKTSLGLGVIGLLPMPPVKNITGKVWYKKVNLLDLDKEEIRRYRGTEIAMIFQEPITSLNPVYKVGQQIEEAIAIRDSRTTHKNTDANDRRNEIIESLNRVRIPDAENVANRYPFELSGGMRQRIMIAMALAQKPSLLIADEPTTALDVTTQAQVLKLMRNLMNEVNTSILLITHDLAVASQVADKVAVMYGGQIVEEAEVNELFSAPSHPYTQGLLSCIPTGSKTKARLKPIQGNVLDLKQTVNYCKFAPRCPHVMDKCWASKPDLRTVEGEHKAACYLHE
ncbi:MAG TPA: ABC transporter ATP-binding protein [Candidatus Acidoferrum sp.]|nr:ABC transporter ATP-binding protein [Candidatus Acidoferrum sp.]